MSNLTLDKDGVSFVRSFLSKDLADKLNSELSFLFSQRSINGSMGYIDLSNSGYLSLNSSYSKIAFPTLSIKSLNILELSLSVLDLVAKELEKNKKDYHLTSLEVFEEKNPTPLYWHTDNRKGMIRCLLYILGGDTNSGSYMYMKGTHKRDYNIKHILPDEQVNKLKDKIYICEGRPGDLILSDTLGFHANRPRLKKRRVIIFEYQPSEQAVGPQSNIFLSSSFLTDEIIKNIDVFRNKAKESNSLHGNDVDFFNVEKNRYHTIYGFITLIEKSVNRLKYIINKIVKKIFKF
jgi:hypothetical protein